MLFDLSYVSFFFFFSFKAVKLYLAIHADNKFTQTERKSIFMYSPRVCLQEMILNNRPTYAASGEKNN